MVPRAATQRGIMVISVDILGLPFFKATNVAETKDTITIDAESIYPYKDGCPFCREGKVQVKFGSKSQSFVDAPVRGRQVMVVIDRQRFRCKGCGRTHSQIIPHLDDKRFMTERCLEYIQSEALRKTFVQVADEVGVVEGTVRRVFVDFIAKLEQKRIIETPEWLGIDELTLCGELRCILTDVKVRKIMDILPKRDKKTVKSYLQSIPTPERIQVITMDMWKPYKEVVHDIFPDAQVVVDKFHIVRMANYCLDLVRRDARGDLTPSTRNAFNSICGAARCRCFARPITSRQPTRS